MNRIIHVTSATTLTFEDRDYRCAIGKGGFCSPQEKTEGDGKTPLGTYPLRECWYRLDRIAPPQTHLTTHIISPDDGWCDAPKHPYYNKPITLPFETSHETLWREDNRYDVMVPMGYNDAPIVPGKGSAIFFHLAAEDYRPTEGCVAVNLEDMRELLNATHMRIEPENQA